MKTAAKINTIPPHRHAEKRRRFCPVTHALSLLVVASLGLIQPSARAEIVVVTANPGENSATQMNIGWHADLDEGDCQLVYTKKSDAEWAEATTVVGTSQMSDVFDGIPSKLPDGQDWNEEAVFLNCGVNLSGLEPDTEYMYRITGGNDASEETVRHFKTAGASEFTFLWISDVHGYSPLPNRLRHLNRVAEAALEIEPSVDFVFSTGDNVAWGGSYSFWVDFFDLPFLSDYMFADVIGNHDWMRRRDGGSDAYFDVTHNNPRNGYPGQEGVCYWFIYGDVLFLTFNNEAMRVSSEAEAEAKAWAESVIQEQRGNYERIFIAEHYQWFDGRNGRSSWYDHWREFCDAQNVTLALAGNNHIYKRTHPLRGDQVVADGLGTVYMDAPSSDGGRGRAAGPLTMNADKLAHIYASQLHLSETSVRTIACVLVDVGPNSIRTRLVYLDDDMEVQVADDHTITTLPSDAPRLELQEAVASASGDQSL